MLTVHGVVIMNEMATHPAVFGGPMLLSPHEGAVHHVVVPVDERVFLAELCRFEGQLRVVLGVVAGVPGPVRPREELLHQRVVVAFGREPGERGDVEVAAP